MPQRNCTKDKDEIAKAIKRITLPIEMEKLGFNFQVQPGCN